MSVEEARADVTTAMIAYGDARAANDGRMIEKPMQPPIDRLILEAKAEMPCYRDATNKEPCRGVGEPLDLFIDEPLCPSCTARMKLKETADAR